MSNEKNAVMSRSHGGDPAMPKTLSPIAVWALAFGCSVGWGSFVMPGTTFLPIAGPLGSLLGLVIGAVIMFVIGVNFHYLMNRFPEAGGAYTFSKKVLGSDHGFLCAWLLILTYVAIVWANATALALIARNLFGDLFCFGFSYQIAGFTVYFGEVLLSVALLVVACLVCVIGRGLLKWVQTVLALLLLVGVVAIFAAVVVHRGGVSGLEPDFSTDGAPVSQVFGIVILAPWAFIGFESVSHTTPEFRFSPKKALPIMGFALVTGALTYILLTLCAAFATPEGFPGWEAYIDNLGSQEGLKALPTFFGAQTALGTPGLVILGVAAFAGIATGVIACYVAVSRLIYSMSQDQMIPAWFGKAGKHKTPVNALLFVTAISVIIPLFGRTAIGWIVDVTTIGAAIVYGYTSICSYIMGRRESDTRAKAAGLAGFLISVAFIVYYMLPNLWSQGRLSTESYFMLAVWCVLGIFMFRVLMGRDRSRRMGKSEIVWIVLLFLILVISTVWIHDYAISESANMTRDIQEVIAQAGQQGASSDAVEAYIAQRTDAFAGSIITDLLVQAALIAVSVIIIFSIFLVIKKREKQIEAERLRAEESSKAKTVFLSNMSHDIRTPMNAVTGYTALALKEKDVPAGVRNYLTKIDTSSRHLLTLINDILDMSRIESGKLELDPAPADLIAVMDEVYDIFSTQMQTKSLTYTVDTSQVTDRTVICDKNYLHRVLMNLISNAYKFTPEGGSIGVSLIQVGRNETDAVYELRVKDSGIGMSDEFAEHIFEAFERERDKTVTGIQGTGLGMSITKSLVELMNGSIRLHTKKGQGTEFIIFLSFPVTEAETVIGSGQEQLIEQNQLDFGKMPLLLVDDNPINREIACAILEQAGFPVDQAENGKIAVDKVTASPPDTYAAILMDIQMPVMNGYDATKAIRALPGQRSEIPIIAMSANAFAEDVQEAKSMGMNAHIAKPIEIDVMINTLIKEITRKSDHTKEENDQ